MNEKIEAVGRDGLFRKENVQEYLPWVLMAFALLIMTLQLWYQGRIWWCKWDSPIHLWSGGVWTKHDSQHFADAYFFTHLLHGFLFFWGAKLLFREKISFAWMLFAAVVGEAIWEVLENAPFIIERYRANTASLEYFGDSIANSIGDVAACILGFIAAYFLRFWRAFAVFILIELVLLVTIRDGLLLNIIMLIYPIEGIKDWQMG